MKKTMHIVLFAFGLSSAACYHSGPTPPCSVNSGNPGCYPFPSDAKKPVPPSDQGTATKK